MAQKRKKSNTSLRAPVRSRGSSRRSSSGSSILWVLSKWVLILGIWGAIILGGVLAWFATDLPDITKAAIFEKQPSITVLAADGAMIARYGETKGRSLRVEEMPKHLIEAVLATEDRRFYDHPGVDIFGILRALITNAVEGRVVQGGSTITQQLAKNLFLTHDRTLKRKIQEAMLALWLEHRLTKDEILGAYLNRVYLGSGIYGVDAAARLYFDKPLKEINLREAATLAGLLKAPSRYSPLNNPTLAKERADVVLEAMADAGYITKDEAKGLVQSTPTPPGKKPGANARKYFADWVIDGLDDLVGTPEMDLVVETSLDSGIQANAETVLTASLAANGADHHISQGSVLMMRPDGAIIAMVGGRDYDSSQFNRTVQALRSPGSSFKPIVYLAALDQGWTPQSMILDAPITEGRYRPDNYGGEYFGEVRLIDALTMSMNTATIRLMKEVGVQNVINTARKMGIISKLEPDLSLGLGSSGISQLEMTTAYAMLSNGGHRIFPYAIERIKDSKGTILYQRKAPTSYQRVLNSRSVEELKIMMRSVVENGTGQRAQIGVPVYGKTGTSQESRDAWFIGFTDQVVASVWLGNDDNSPMKKVTGGLIPAQVWHDVAIKAQGRYPAFGYAAPDIAPSGYGGGDLGISGLIGRLISNDNQGSSGFTPAPPRPQGDYSNLND